MRPHSLALMEGDAATALEYGRAAAEVDPNRRWTTVQSNRLMLTLRLADSHARSGDINAAMHVARPVIRAAESTQITLIHHELDRLRTRLGDRSADLFDGC